MSVLLEDSPGSMPIILYQIPLSEPCRAVMMTAEALGIKLVQKHVDLWSGEQMKPEFLAINPQHSVPTIDDDGFILWESRAIMQYLVNKYAPNSPLYPKEPNARAIVDKILNFDLGHLYRNTEIFYSPMLYENKKTTAEKEENMKKSLEILEKLLESTTYTAGNHVTIADYSIFSCLVFVEVLFEYSFAPYPRISAYLKRLKKESPKYKEIHEIPLQEFKKYGKSKR